MKIPVNKKILLSVIFNCVIVLQAQQPAFYHLSTAEGLSDNQVNSLQRDRNGILWLGTAEGLNSFDGNTITSYFKEQYPALGSNHISQVVCDYNNRIWTLSESDHIAMLDENRRFHPIQFVNDAGNDPVRHIVLTKKHGMLVLKGDRYFKCSQTGNSLLEPLDWPAGEFLPKNIRSVSKFDGDRIIYCGDDRVVVLDFAQQRVDADISMPGIDAAAPLNAQELLATCIKSNSLFRIGMRDKKIAQYKGLIDQYGQPVSKDLRNICRLNENQWVITSRFSGAYLFDINNKSVQRWHHDAVDLHSLGGDNTLGVMYDSSGYLFIMTRTTGLHYFNALRPTAAHKSFFVAGNKIFDGFIQSISMDNNGVLWLGAQDRLIKWNRQTGQCNFTSYRLSDGTLMHGEETIRTLLSAKNGDLWLGTSRYGILLLDTTGKTRSHFYNAPGQKQSVIPSNWINDMIADKKGNLWIGTLRGLCRIDARTKQVQDFSDHIALAPLSTQACNALFFDHSENLWIGTNAGAWCYNEAGNTIKKFTTENGLSNNKVLSINEDNYRQLYFGTAYGMTVMPANGNILRYDRTNGIRNDKCEGILCDKDGFIWIGNQHCILRFDPAKHQFAVFEEGFGLSHAGFRMRSCYKSGDGELFWASDKGLYYFYPQQLSSVNISVQPVITGVRAGETVHTITRAGLISIPHNNLSYTFRFSSGDLSGANKIQFTYRLLGYEQQWKKPLSRGQATYNRLPPGHYEFQLKASRDGNTWYNASYPVSIFILKPWWQQSWFRVSYLLILGALAAGTYFFLRKRKQMATTRKTIEYFAQSGYDQSSVGDILWDICRNCISGLHFEDCVIYLLDDEKKVLVQKAAYGPKNPRAFEIENPIEIPVGKGIVGTVAATGKAVIVSNTSRDERYIVDDKKRLSEIAVPLIHEGKVIGIIDAENRRRNFFTSRHLHTLQTIASLCSAKISRAMAMDAMKKSRLEVMELNIKMVESKFLNLRLQMNPHFLFNSLSSIQNLIVSQQTTRAYKYLTVFSHFLRSLLTHADQNFITLDEEVGLLKRYTQLEALRFDKSFQYEISVDEGLVNDEIWIPSLLVQPFAENAIWHGLMHKTGDKRLHIRFFNNADDYLTCIIEDNGIGRDRSRQIRKKKISSFVYQSKGISIVEERLGLLQQKTGKPAKVEILDLFNEKQEPAGTRIVIVIPYYNPEEV